MKEKHESVKMMWRKYLNSIGEKEDSTKRTYTSWYFCDNEKDAAHLAKLVLAGTKRGTASLVDSFEKEGEQIPKAGDLSIITDWNGIAQCMIETCNITITPFKDVTAAFALREGEGDKSLAYWRDAHVAFFTRELEAENQAFHEDMLVVCEEFEVVFK